MSRPSLIDDYLDALRGQLPADAVTELADGLIETYDCHCARGLAPDAAARAAIADFGTPHLVAQAFAQIAPGRRAARALLATGPVVGACWALALMTARAWAWPIHLATVVALAAGLILVVATLVAACRSPYRRARNAALAGGTGVLALDVAALTILPTSASVLTGLLQCAIVASSLRLCLTLGSLYRLLISS